MNENNTKICTFDFQLKNIERMKSQYKRRTDAEIEKDILESEDWSCGFMGYRPVLKYAYPEGYRLNKRESLDYLVGNNFVNKNIIKREVKKGKAYSLVKSGVVTFIHN